MSLRIPGVVGQHQQFAGTRQQIDGHVAHHQSFSGDDVGVARTKNLADLPDRGRAVGHRSNGLRATHPINLGGSRRPRGEEQRGIDRAVLAAGGTNHNFGTSRHFGQLDRHERRRNQRSSPAGDIHSYTLKRIEFFAHHRAVGVAHLPVLPARFPSEGGNVTRGFLDGLAQRSVGVERSRQELRLGDGQLVRPEARAIKPLRQFQYRRVAPRPHIVEDGPRALLDLRVEQAGRVGQLGQTFPEVGIGVAYHFHERPN